MPAFAPITLTERDNTTTHVFNPSRVEANDVYRYTEADPSGVAGGENILRVSLKEDSGVTRVRVKIEMPSMVTETINGVARSKVERRTYADAFLNFPTRAGSTADERTKIVGLLSNALSGLTDVDDLVIDLNSVF